MNETPLSVRVNRLFTLAHSTDAPEPTTAHVSAGVSKILGRDVDVESVNAIREGTDPDGDPAVLAALAAYFHAPAQYLSDTDYHDYDTLIRFKLAVRAAGVNHLSMRGSPDGEHRLSATEMERMISMLQNLPNQLGTDSR